MASKNESAENIRRLATSLTMNAGEGPLSYAKNSSYQGGMVDVVKPIIEEEIAKKLDIRQPSSISTNAFCVADFGCSTGHNSFPVMEHVIQAIKQKHAETSGGLITSDAPEFFVFFNDTKSNDFDTLFSSLPPESQYTAAGVPGDFHGRLLPRSSLHFGYSSWSLQWLTDIPKAVIDSSSPAWNKGEILYTPDRREVCKAFLDQYAKDIEAFLEARAVEVVAGGLMVLVIPANPDSWNPETEYTLPSEINLLGSCLMAMAKNGRLSEAKVDSFNIPNYFPTSQELKAILDRSHSFTIERLETIDNPGKHSLPDVEARVALYRAVFESLLTQHFGSEVIDELFDLFRKMLVASPAHINPGNDKSIVLLVVLQRKSDNR